MTQLNAADMFDELIRLGHIAPRSDYPDLMMPSALHSVRSITTSGTGPIASVGGAANAELERGDEGDSGD